MVSINMEDLTNKILQLLKEEGVELKNAKNELSKVIENIENRFWIKLQISPSLFYNLKDTIWYNLEHLPNGGNVKGKDDLRFIGSNYPVLMYSGNDDIYINTEQLQPLLLELEDISKKWSNQWSFVQLFTKSANGWNGGKDDPSPVIIYEPSKGETPGKYGYYQSSKSNFGIFNSNGEFMNIKQKEIVLCAIETKLGTYGREPMMRTLLDRLIDACRRGIQNQKGIILDFETYNYMN